MKKGLGLLNFVPEPNTGCFLWLGAILRNGYGYVRAGRRMRLAHRAVYEAERGGVPSTFTLDHLCRQRSCVNPAHLEPVPIRENILRGTSPTAKNARKTHCPRGHPYTGENLFLSNKGRRCCRACARANCRAQRREK